MNSVTWRCWVVLELALVPLALFCWYSTLLWLAVALYQHEPVSRAELGGAIGFGAFGLLHHVGLRWGHLVKPAWRWLLLITPAPWLAAFLIHLLDDELSYPGDGFLPAAWRAAATGYLVVLLALTTASLIGALADAVESRRPRKPA